MHVLGHHARLVLNPSIMGGGTACSSSVQAILLLARGSIILQIPCSYNAKMTSNIRHTDTSLNHFLSYNNVKEPNEGHKR